jgi:CBS domain-containing protein
MSKPVLSVSADSTVDEVINLMIAKKISSVPVVRGDSLAGLVTRDSLIRAL